MNVIRTLALACLLALVPAAPALAGGNVNLYIWSEYLPDAIVEQFTAETGIAVTVTTYDSNEALYAKIKMLDGGGYDVIVPSSDFVSLMRKEGLLLPLDKKLLPNAANIGPRFSDQAYDPGNAYSVPYMWGSTALAVDKEALGQAAPASYRDLAKTELAGRLLLPNDLRGVMGIGLKVTGHSLNDTDPAHLEEAFQFLRTVVGNVRVYDSDSPKQALLGGEVQAAVMWNGEAYVATQENPAIAYIYPPEGYSLWVDSLCIPKTAPDKAEAHALINFLLRPDVSAAISQEMGYATPLPKARELLPDDVRDNPVIFPPDADLARGEFEDDLGPAVKLYEDYWMRLKMGH